MGIKHTKVSTVTDAAATTKVRPSDWNEDHTIDGDVDFGGYAILNATGGGGGAEAFTDLTDVPATYSGSGGKLVAVNGGASGLEFVNATAADLSGLGWITPQDYYPDAGTVGHEGDAIDATDISVHTEWIGTYSVGSYWSYVALQEAIYGALAYYDSTPGTVVWNNVNARKNKVIYVPPGEYYINHQLHLVGQNVNFMCSGRNQAVITWYGGRNLTGNSHTSTTIDGLDASVLATVDINDENYIIGPGIPETGARVTAKASSTSITLSAATTSTVVGGQWYLFHSAFKCNSASYGAFHNLALTAGYTLPSAYTTSGDWHSYGPALLDLDNDGNDPGLKTQQLTFYEPVIGGAAKTDIGITLNPLGGGSAQGDTILFINPYVSQCVRYGLHTLGANALSVQIINGDFQYCRYAGVRAHGGSVYVNGTSFQSPGVDLSTTPAVNSIISMSGDINLQGFGGPSSTSDIQAIRSEGGVSVYAHSDALPNVSNCANSFSEGSSRFDNYPFRLGDYTHQGSPTRTFVVVSCGGPDIWYRYSSGSGNTLTLVGASWTVNAWIGLFVFERFGSNGFTQQIGTVTSNTANTVTWSGSASSPAADSYYFIGGQTAGSSPGTAAFTAAVSGARVFDPTGGQGFTTTAGSTTVNVGSAFTGIAVGDYIICPSADQLGATQAEVAGIRDRVPPIRCALITRLTADLGSNNFTMAKAAAFTLTGAPGWAQCSGNSGTVVTDGNLKWMPVETYDFWQCGTLVKCTARQIYNCTNVTGLRVSNDYNWLTLGTPSSVDTKNLISGKQAINPTTAISPSVTPVDISATLEAGDVTTFTPTQNITLNVASLDSVGYQKWTLVVVTSGTTSYTITFGTNFHVSSSTLVTGVVDARRFILEFIVSSAGLYEMSRTAAL